MIGSLQFWTATHAACAGWLLCATLWYAADRRWGWAAFTGLGLLLSVDNLADCFGAGA